MKWGVNKLLKPKDFDHVLPNEKLDQLNEAFANVFQPKYIIDAISLTNSPPLQYNHINEFAVHRTIDQLNRMLQVQKISLALFIGTSHTFCRNPFATL